MEEMESNEFKDKGKSNKEQQDAAEDLDKLSDFVAEKLDEST